MQVILRKTKQKSQTNKQTNKQYYYKTIIKAHKMDTNHRFKIEIKNPCFLKVRHEMRHV